MVRRRPANFGCPPTERIQRKPQCPNYGAAVALKCRMMCHRADPSSTHLHAAGHPLPDPL